MSRALIPHPAAGFSFIEIVVALAIMTMIAAVVTPTLFSNLDRARVDRTVATLESLLTAVDAFETDVKESAGALSQLVEPIQTSEKNVCGNNYSNNADKGGIRAWKGPYMNRSIPPTGLPVGIGIAQNAIEVHPSGGSRIVVKSVAETDAGLLNDRVDADDDRLAGAIQWSTADASGLVDLYYVVPRRRC